MKARFRLHRMAGFGLVSSAWFALGLVRLLRAVGYLPALTVAEEKRQAWQGFAR
jgi:hypothetical protein